MLCSQPFDSPTLPEKFKNCADSKLGNKVKIKIYFFINKNEPLSFKEAQEFNCPQ